MKALLDTNVLLDLLAGRTPYLAAATAVWIAAEEKHFEGVVCSVSYATLFYLGRRTVGNDLAMAGIRKVHRLFQTATVDNDVISAAIASGMVDFEDAIQAFFAVSSGASCIVTRDRSGFAASPLRVLTPEQFIDELR